MKAFRNYVFTPQAPNDGAMSIDRAIAALDASDVVPADPVVGEKPEPEVPVTEEVEQTPDVNDEIEEPELTDDEGDDANEETETEAEAKVDAPKWWNAEEKELFAKLTPDVQNALLAQETKREAATQRLKTEYEASAKQAKEEVESVRTLLTNLRSSKGAVAEYESKYGGVDFNNSQAWAEFKTNDPQGFADWVAQYQFDTIRYNQIKADMAEAERLSDQNFAREQAVRLTELAPDMAKNPEILKSLTEYIPQTGIPAENLKAATAEELIVLNKARLYDELMAKTVTKASEAPKKATPAKVVPPVGTAPTPAASKQRQIQAQKNRLSQTRSIDDAVRLLDMS